MTQGNSMKLIFQFFLPILIGNLFQQLYSFVDSMVVGKGIGDVALAAVGNTSSVHFLILGFAMGLTGGLGICISHSFGANDIEKLRKEIAMSVYICLAIGIVITVGSLFWMRRLFVFLQTPEDMMTDTLVYFGTILAGSTVTIFNNFAMTLLRSVGNSKVPLASMIVSSVVNIVLDLLFVFPFGMGVFGAALATVLAQVVSALYCLVYIRRAAELLPRKTDWRADGVLLGALVGKGLPVAVMNSVTAVGGMYCKPGNVFVGVTHRLDRPQMGTAYVAAYAACMKVCGLFEQPGITLGLALLTFTGQNYGAGKYDRIKQGVRAGVVLSVLVNLPFAALEIFCPKLLASLMLNDATVISYTCIFLPVTGVALFALGWLFVFRNACQGMGKTVLPMVSGIVEVAMRVMVVLLLAPRLAFRGVAFAEISAWVGAGVMLMITYFFYQRRLSGKTPDVRG